MLAHLIQRQVPIGSQVTFSLKNGRDISGILTEIGRDHVTIEHHGNSTTILVDMIGIWEVKAGEGETTYFRPANARCRVP